MFKIFFVQLKTLLPTIIKLYLLIIILFLISLLIISQSHLDMEILTRDPAAVAATHPLTGMISNIGILLWCSCAAICLFCFKLLKNKPLNREFSSFFLLSGYLTAILVLDDLFLLHEDIFPKYLNISEKVVLCTYAIVILLYLAKFKKLILKTDFFFLFLSFIFFSLSILSEIMIKKDLIMLEDWLKLFGIVNWLAYFTRVCFQQIEKTFQSQQIERERIRTSI
ncbi:hypothetical protein STA3757_04860 [Stanieria sp. NIES-3757]|nr:hypothetical protein STA3757_04860 [Stanieria sp. NIES-3757]